MVRFLCIVALGATLGVWQAAPARADDRDDNTKQSEREKLEGELAKLRAQVRSLQMQLAKSPVESRTADRDAKSPKGAPARKEPAAPPPPGQPVLAIAVPTVARTILPAAHTIVDLHMVPKAEIMRCMVPKVIIRHRRAPATSIPRDCTRCSKSSNAS